MRTKKTNSSDGFTLVELSIVLIIIGLIIAGVTAGSSLIKTAEINSVVADFRSYQTAYNNFVGRYGQAPGDYNGANTTWTALSNAACNGNNDGAIGTSSPAQIEVQNAMYELSASGMITTAISATPSASCSSFNFSSTSASTAYLPSSKAQAGLYSLINSAGAIIGVGTVSGFPAPASGVDVTNSVLLGKATSTTTAVGAPYNNTAVYPAIHAASIDVKADDGIPNTGLIRSADGTGLNAVCLNAGAATYNKTNTALGCIIGFMVNS